MSVKKIKKAFPVISGTEVSIRYKNRFNNIVAINIGEKGFPIEDNPEITDDLKVKIMQNIQTGMIYVKEVEVKKAKTNDTSTFLNDFDSLIKPKTEATKPEATKPVASKSTPAPAPKRPTRTEEKKEPTKVDSAANKKDNTPPTKK